MSVEANIARIPVHDFSPSPSYRQGSLFAADERAGSHPQVREPDRILVIEDDLLIATQIGTALTEAGFEIIGIATTGHEAVEMGGRDHPDLAVVDIRLAGDRDGVDTALELFRLHGIRCIFASAHTDHEARQRAEPAGPLGWLQKPYTMASLTHMVRRAAKELRGKARE